MKKQLTVSPPYKNEGFKALSFMAGAIALSTAVIFTPSSASALTFNFQFDNSPNGTVTDPIVGIGTFSFDGDLDDGTFPLSALPNYALPNYNFSFTFTTFIEPIPPDPFFPLPDPPAVPSSSITFKSETLISGISERNPVQVQIQTLDGDGERFVRFLHRYPLSLQNSNGDTLSLEIDSDNNFISAYRLETNGRLLYYGDFRGVASTTPTPVPAPVPEPVTILGSLVALGIGTAFKHKSSKSCLEKE